MGLKVDKCPESDILRPRVLTDVTMELVDALAIILHNSTECGTVPVDWKVANVTRLFQKGGREKTGND